MNDAPAPRILEGRVVAFFAFDIAESIDLGAIPSVLRPERAQIVPRKPAPAYLEYAVPPMEITLVPRALELASGEARACVSARLFDFGAASLGFMLPLPATLDVLPGFAHSLAQAELGALARRVLDELAVEIRPALRGHGRNDLVEDYFVFHVAGFDVPLDAQALLRAHAPLLAATLAMEAGPLARQQVEESVRDAVSYSPHDLVLADWSAAFVYDASCADTLAVLEFLNVQLVEFRFLDARLDRALTQFSSEIYRSESLWRAIRGPHRAAIRALSAHTVEVTSLTERVENALKLVADVYLARVHRRCAARLGLPTWERMVQSKLDAVRHLTTVLVERAAARRAEALELTIIALIALEIGLALLGGRRD